MPSKIIEPPMSTGHELWVGFDMGTDHVRGNNNVIGAHVHEGGTSGETGVVTGCVTTVPSGLLGATSISTKTVMPAGVFKTFRSAFEARDAAAAATYFGLRPEQLSMEVEVTPATPEQRAVRIADTVTVTLSPLSIAGEFDRVSDLPGIAAMKAKAAKSVKPAPEPILSIGGSEFDAAELLEALQHVRARKAVPVKETPRGLMVVRELDHRLGLWGGEGC